ncbi:ABC transporter substrate-binding protein [Fictibacillus enclensis]|uniref:ABC transporter substrate-binding protein n=1 Tax=Fictibacillus enclensis TaxID=1017270 RepID=UPI0025A0E963|nr:ABC transporter substrate-binding protein [Fictibacillus enclensis]MDM5339544.1 ABC transporter substrate-binding protein [Fictibacillus enclensis]
MVKNMKKFSLAAGVLSASLLFTAACSSDGASGDKASGSKGDKVVIDMFQGKVEIADQLKALTDQYTKEHPNVTFNIETVGGGADGGAALKAKFASNKAPDIFTSSGYQDAVTWKDKLEDLSDQPWVKNAYPNALKPMTLDGKVLGQPVNLEGYGFAYNKDLFKKAGITKLPTTFSELEAAAKKLKAKGITPFSVGYGEWWVLANHGLNVPLAYQESADKNFIKGLNEGKAKIADSKYFDDYFKLLDLTIKYGNKNPLTTDYNTQVTLFASGDAAMIQQGNWIQPMIDKITPNMNVGFIPMALNNNEKEADKLMADVPSNWVVYNKAPKADKKAAKDFLNWMVSSKEGKEALTKEFKYIPAFKNIDAKAEDIGPLGAEIQKYSKEGKTYTWQFMKYPDGAGQEFGSALQAYVGKKKSEKETLEALDATWNKLKK